MFIELTDEEKGMLTLINVDDIRSVYESNSNRDNAVIYFRSGDPALTTTESYAEVITMVRNATEPAEVKTDWSFIPSATGSRSPAYESDYNDEKLPWEQ